MQFRIGINLGDVIEEGSALYGDGVNVAARLEALAQPGGICISGTAFEQVDGKLPLTFKSIGQQQVKNIPKPVRTYRVFSQSEVSADDKRSFRRLWHNNRVRVVAVVIIGLGAVTAGYLFIK